MVQWATTFFVPYSRGVDRDAAHQLLLETFIEREEAKDALTSARVTIESARLIIQGILRRFPDLESEIPGQLLRDSDDWETGDERPRGAEAVLSVLEVNENKWFSVARMVDELAERGWLPEGSSNPSNATRAALERLVKTKDSHVEKAEAKTGGVIYRYSELPATDPWSLPAGAGISEEPPF